jgi:hypothetical protein
MRAPAGRHKVLALAVCLAFITYLDRVCISVTAPDIMRELSLTKVQMVHFQLVHARLRAV